ncbi:MAG: hypothetical protein OXF54_17465 [Caldilineaceae bacterium]|nr:hypothetical protein [Caldilineaceae bacterium]
MEEEERIAGETRGWDDAFSVWVGFGVNSFSFVFGGLAFWVGRGLAVHPNADSRWWALSLLWLLALAGFWLMFVSYYGLTGIIGILWGGGWSVSTFENASAAALAPVLVVGGWLLWRMRSARDRMKEDSRFVGKAAAFVLGLPGFGIMSVGLYLGAASVGWLLGFG